MKQPCLSIKKIILIASLSTPFSAFGFFGFSFIKSRLQQVAYSGVAPSAEVFTVAANSAGSVRFGGGYIHSMVSRAAHKIIKINSVGVQDTAFGQANGFSGGTGNNFLSGVVQQSTGKFVVIGYYDSYAGQSSPQIMRLNSDGTMDATFNPGAGVNSSTLHIRLVVQSDDKIIACGFFSSYDGNSRNGLVRILANGAIDNTFAVGTGFTGTVTGCNLLANGKILVFGSTLTDYNGTGINGVVRLNSDGSIDGTFTPGTAAANIAWLEVLANGKLLMGGNFTTYNGNSANYIVRTSADGVFDGTFNNLGSGFNALTFAAKELSTGKIVVLGNYTTYNGTGSTRIIQLNADGTIDGSFSVGTGFDAISSGSLLEQPDGKIVAIGGFSTYNGTSSPRIIRLNTDGTADVSFVVGTGFDLTPKQIIRLADGSFVVVGSFDSYKFISTRYLASFDSTGNESSAMPLNGVLLGISSNTKIFSSAFQSDGKLVVGGMFLTYDGNTRRGLMRFNTDGTLDAGFPSNTSIPLNGIVRSLVIQSDGKVVLAVDNYSKKVMRTSSANVNDAGFSVGATGFDDTVYSLALQADGKIIAVGNFLNLNAVAQVRMARLNTDGSLDATLSIGAGLDAAAYVTTVQSDGKILVGGSFTQYNGANKNRIVRLNSDGSVDAGFSIGTGFNGAVRCLLVQSDGYIIVGGEFTQYNGVTMNRLARLNSDGTLDRSFNWGVGFDNTVRSIAQLPNGQLLVGGEFSKYDSKSALYFITLAGPKPTQ